MAWSDWDDRFHQAAKDGNLDLLAKANRKDANTKDEDGMTPTNWAAYYGNLAALRKIIERGGKPDHCDNLGNSALHCAAARGHFNCASYLVNFGCNLWAMDNSHRTALDLASLNDHDDIVKLLDQARAGQKAKNPKHAQKQQENAVSEATGRIKEFEKLQKKLQTKMKNDETRPASQMTPAKPAGFYKTITGKFRSGGKTSGDPQTPAGIVTSRTGEAILRQPDPMSQKRLNKVLTDDTDSLASDVTFRSDSGYGDEDQPNAFPIRSGLPGLSLNFMTKMRPLQAADLYGLSANHPGAISEEDEEQEGAANSVIDSAGNGANFGGKNSRWNQWRELDLSEEEEDEPETDLKLFLATHGLGKFYSILQKESVDMETLLLLTETDLEKLGLELGPRKRLMHAILRVKADLESDLPSTVISNSKL